MNAKWFREENSRKCARTQEAVRAGVSRSCSGEKIRKGKTIKGKCGRKGIIKKGKCANKNEVGL